MTKHEAIEVLEEVKMLDDSMFAYSQAYNDALDMAIEALKAQDEKSVHVTAEINRRKIGVCPNCGVLLNSDDYPKYCGKCGQAVKWHGDD